MRSIPAELLSRIQSLNQTIHGNANPLMSIKLIKASKVLDINTIRTENRVGSVDIAVGNNLTWIISIVNGGANVRVYDYIDNATDLTSYTDFDIEKQELGATIRDVAVTQTGTSDPFFFWVERGTSTDKIWTVQWDGTGTMPSPTELFSRVRS